MRFKLPEMILFVSFPGNFFSLFGNFPPTFFDPENAILKHQIVIIITQNFVSHFFIFAGKTVDFFSFFSKNTYFQAKEVFPANFRLVCFRPPCGQYLAGSAISGTGSGCEPGV